MDEEKQGARKKDDKAWLSDIYACYQVIFYNHFFLMLSAVLERPTNAEIEGDKCIMLIFFVYLRLSWVKKHPKWEAPLKL